jgi:hypothetical protein
MRFQSFTCTFTECCRNITYTVISDKASSKEHPLFGPVTVQAHIQLTWVDVSKTGSSIAFIKGVNEHGNEVLAREFNITVVQSSQAPNMAPFFERELEDWIINLTKSVGENMTYQLPATYDTHSEDTVTLGVVGNHSNVWLNAKNLYLTINTSGDLPGSLQI